jgi:hypothetical protein
MNKSELQPFSLTPVPSLCIERGVARRLADDRVSKNEAYRNPDFDRMSKYHKRNKLKEEVI